MVDTPWSGFTDQAYLLPTDTMLLERGGGGINVPAAAVPYKDDQGNYVCMGEVATGPRPGFLRYARMGMDNGYTAYWSVNAWSDGANDKYVADTGYGGMACRLAQNPSNGLRFSTASGGADPVTWVDRFRVDQTGVMLVGAATGVWHTIRRSVPEGTTILSYDSAAGICAYFNAVDGAGTSAASSGLSMRAHSVTGRSINTGGTINGSGADPAEYWRRKALCGTILSGQICGINVDNELTTDWADAVRFGVKSGLINQPFMVGNDVYARVHEEAAGPRPVEPAPIDAAPIEPVVPEPFDVPEPVQGESEGNIAYAVRLVAWTQAAQIAAARMAAYMAAVSAYPAALAEWTALNEAYQAELSEYEDAEAVWQAGLEAERQRWDRLSIGGQVYIRTEQACEAGDYVIPVQVGDGIGFAFVPDAEITWDQYRRKVGVVLTTAGEWPLIEVLRS